VQPHSDGWGNFPANPSFGANEWPIDLPHPLVHFVVASASFPLPPVHPVLLVHTFFL
jgi:hypothetical protein